MTGGRRLPDFIIIGAQKSASTSLYRWLAEQPEVYLAWPKETDFFSVDANWDKGVSWYASLFADAGADRLAGEASVSYSSRDRADVVAERMAAVVPDVKILYILRHPIERLRSHYRHELQRGREAGSLAEVVRRPGNPYVGNSLYHRCLTPFADAFPEGQICVVRFEDLVGGGPAWNTVLEHLGLADRACPGTAFNVTAEKPQYTQTMAALRRSGVLSFRWVARLPRPVRRLGRRFLMQDGTGYREKLQGSMVELPQEIEQLIWADAAHLERWLGAEHPLWERVRDAA